MRKRSGALALGIALVTFLGPAVTSAKAGPSASGVGTITEYSVSGPGRADPADITLGPDGNMWFTERARDAIGRITPAGQITEFPLSVGRASYITSGPDGALWFTTTNGAVVRMTVAGLITRVFTVEQALGPDIATGPDGNLWVAAGTEIWRVTPTGTVASFTAPSGAGRITAGPDGNLWYTSAGLVGRISPDGVVAEFAVPENELWPGHTELSDITAGNDGNVWFADLWDRIGKVSPTGVITMFPVGANTPVPGALQGLAAGPDGGMWFTVYNFGRIARLAPDGSRMGYALPAQFSGPFGIALGPHNTLWFTELGQGDGAAADRIGSLKVCGGNNGCSLPSTGKPK